MQLGYCEIYKPKHHGILNINEYPDKKHIYTSLLFQFSLTLHEFYDNSIDTIKKDWEERGPWRIALNTLNNYNPYVRNTKAIKLNKLEIVKVLNYNGYEFCIIKTLWLKILQRKFKNYYKKLLLNRKNPKNLFKRSVLGKWNY